MNESRDAYKDFFNVQNELQALFRSTMERIMDEERITVAQAFTLKTLKEKEGLCRMSDLAASLLHTPAAMTGLVDRLIILQLVERKSDDRDRRVILLALTDRGTATLARIEEKVQAIMRRFFDSMPEKDRAAAARTLQKLKEFLKEELDAKN